MKVYGVALMFYSSSTFSYTNEGEKKTLTSECIFNVYQNIDDANRIISELNEKYSNSDKRMEWIKEYLGHKGMIYGALGIYPSIGGFYLKEIEVV
jgi:uncharacterized membrane protein YfhO